MLGGLPVTAVASRADRELFRTELGIPVVPILIQLVRQRLAGCFVDWLPEVSLTSRACTRVAGDDQVPWGPVNGFQLE